jgi:hypothetical protein
MLGDQSRFWLFCSSPLVFLLPKTFKYFGFERTWWRLFRWVYLMKVIPLSVPDEGYSRNVLCILNLLSMVYYLSLELKKGFSITCNLQVILNDYLKSKRRRRTLVLIINTWFRKCKFRQNIHLINHVIS